MNASAWLWTTTTQSLSKLTKIVKIKWQTLSEQAQQLHIGYQALSKEEQCWICPHLELILTCGSDLKACFILLIFSDVLSWSNLFFQAVTINNSFPVPKCISKLVFLPAKPNRVTQTSGKTARSSSSGQPVVSLGLREKSDLIHRRTSRFFLVLPSGWM